MRPANNDHPARRDAPVTCTEKAEAVDALSCLGHELRTPLGAVIGFAQLLRMEGAGSLTSRQSDWVRNIQDAGEHLLAMINDIVNAARNQRVAADLGAVRLLPVVTQALAIATTRAAELGVQVHIQPPPADSDGRLHVRADRLRLRQVLVNLVGNAVKYNRAGGSVSVRWSTSADGARIHLDVQDTGQGMSTEQMSHLFEPYNRLGAEMTSVEGTGIGLAISERLLTEMGGELEVSSEAGVGSCFRVTLPAVCEDGCNALCVPGHLGSAPVVTPRVLTVLCADDNAANLEIMLAVLRNRPGVRAVPARSGRQAIEAARRERPDLMLLDMQLGDMTGLEVMNAVAPSANGSRVPCIVLSTDALPVTSAETKAAGIVDCILKPLDAKTLLAGIDSALATAHG